VTLGRNFLNRTKCLMDELIAQKLALHPEDEKV
jgi:hypothetical protein